MLRLSELKMSTEFEDVHCPRNLEHGLATKRVLPVANRQMVKKSGPYVVFEIICPVCGTYEFVDDRAPKPGEAD
jgi:hypothetical protein